MIKLTELRELEYEVEKMGINPIELYLNAMNECVESINPTQEEIDSVISVLRASRNSIEDKGVIYVTKVKSLDFGNIKGKKLNTILKHLNYKNHRISKGVLLSVPLAKW